MVVTYVELVYLLVNLKQLRSSEILKSQSTNHFIMVFGYLRNNDNGKLSNVAKELLGEGRKLANELGEPLMRFHIRAQY